MVVKKELEAWIEENHSKISNPRPRDIHLTNFLAAKKDIEEWLSEGFSITIICKFLKYKKRINCSYVTFNRYVHKFIDPKLLKKKNQPMKNKPSNGFTFNNKPNKGDLV